MLARIIVSIIIGVTLSAVIIIPLNGHLTFRHILDNPIAIINQKDQGIVLKDRSNRSFFHFYEARSKRLIPLSQVPAHTRQAILAIEDQTFYRHIGFSPRAIVRALITNARAGKIVYGGSTITQQVIKNTLLTPQKSWLRKYQELFLALELEARYTKDAILEIYLNTAYFGEGAFGIEEAAQTYFNKQAEGLTLPESALLAGLLTQPSLLSPLSHESDNALVRQRLVLQNMVEMNDIALAEKQTALSQSLTFHNPPPRNLEAPHFALVVRDELIKEFGESYVERGGLTVVTTLDTSMQQQAEAALQKQLESLAKRQAGNGAVVVIDPKHHEVLALVGSRDWFEEQWGKTNMAISPRQPGSAFKPLVYATAFEQGIITPATTLFDIPTTFGTDYRPADYDGRFRGPVSVRRALANSLNVPAVSVMSKVGVSRVVSLAEDLGLTSLPATQDYNLALALGAGEVSLLELTNAYAVFADQGQFLPTQTILSITDKQGQAVALPRHEKKQVVSSATAFLISSILSDNNARAEIFGRSLTINRPAAVKTGTSQNYRDAWTVGYTPELTIGVWIGNNDNAPMVAAAGALGAAPVWKQLMDSYLKNFLPVAFETPPTIQQITLCRSVPTTEGEPPKTVVTKEYFLAGVAPRSTCRPQPTPPIQLSKNLPQRHAF